MTPEPSDFPSGMRGVYATILRRLWNGEWVSSRELAEKAGQSEFARRTRELRGEYGYPIEREVLNGEFHYRLTGHTPLFPTRRRKYFSEVQKREILHRCGPYCAICKLGAPGSSVSEVSATLMWDHRVPFDNGGETTAQNGQPLCRDCNNLKRQACSTCPNTDCDGCLWAYPERAKGHLLLSLPDKEADALASYAMERGISKREAAENILCEKFKEKTC